MPAARRCRTLARRLIAAVALGHLLAATAQASVVTALDEFLITRSNVDASPLGSYDGQRVFYRDGFADGAPPPAGGSFFNGSSASYVVLGSYDLAAESGGRLTVDSSLGGGFVNAAGGDRILQRSVLPTDANPASQAGLKQAFHTFGVYGLFDLAIPPVAADGYGIAINDGGPLGATVSIDLFVRRELNGNLVIRLQEQDFVNHVIDTIELDAFAPPPGADQIELRLQRADLGSNAITAAYRYWHGGAAMSPFNSMSSSVEFFRRNGWGRGVFFAVQAVPEPGTLALLMPAALGLLWTARRRRS